MHHTGLLAGTVENYIPECRREELSRVLSARRGREGKSYSDTYCKIPLNLPFANLEEGIVLFI